MKDPNRKLIGKWSNFIQRERIYAVPDGIEVEVDERIDVSARRVLYDDVLLVTYHRERGALFLTLTGLFSLGFIALVVYLSTLGPAAIVVGVMFGLFGLPFVIAFLVRAIFGIDVVTVFGRRSKAVIRYRVRKRRAREVHDLVCAAVRNAHQKLAHEYASSPEPQVSYPLPPLPPTEESDEHVLP
jgi:hypothetical protein